MAANSLPVFSPLASVVARVERVVFLSHFTRCYFTDEHCDCRELATVHYLPNSQEFCERHFKAVNRG